MADIIDPNELKTSKKIKTIIADQQQRIFRLEQMLDDLCRSCEIAQYSQQYTITETYRTEAEELLRDRIVLPEIAPTEGGMKLQIVTGEVSDETNKKIAASVKV
jgi:hypothetical protein